MYHSDLVCYVHMHSLFHLNVSKPFVASNGWPRVDVACGLRRVLYRVSYLARMGFVAHVCFPGHGPKRTCVRVKGHVDMFSEQEDKHESEGRVGDRSFFGLEGGAICQALEQQQNRRTSDRRVCGEGSRRWGTWRCVCRNFPCSCWASSRWRLHDLSSGPRLCYPHFTHSFVFPFRFFFVLSAPVSQCSNCVSAPRLINLLTSTSTAPRAPWLNEDFAVCSGQLLRPWPAMRPLTFFQVSMPYLSEHANICEECFPSVPLEEMTAHS